MDVATVAALLGGLVLLIAGAEALVRGAVRLATALGVTPLAIGLTVVAFGTSAPELAVSVRGAVTGAGDVALGNAVGSNVFNLLAVLGLAALAGTLLVHRRVVRLEVPLLLAVTAAVWGLAADGTLERPEGGLLAAGLLAYTLWVYHASRREERAEPGGGPVPAALTPWPRAAGTVLLGLAGLVLGAQLLVVAATQLAAAAGVDELTIGLTVVAVGTSLPELATSVTAAARGQRELAVGNVVGSNLFNLLGVLGLSALLAADGLPVAASAWRGDLPLSALATLAVLPCLATGLVIARWEGGLLLGAYGGYLAVALLTGLDHPAAPTATGALVAGLVAVGVVVTAVGWRQRSPDVRRPAPP